MPRQSSGMGQETAMFWWRVSWSVIAGLSLEGRDFERDSGSGVCCCPAAGKLLNQCEISWQNILLAEA